MSKQNDRRRRGGGGRGRIVAELIELTERDDHIGVSTTYGLSKRNPNVRVPMVTLSVNDTIVTHMRAHKARQVGDFLYDASLASETDVIAYRYFVRDQGIDPRLIAKFLEQFALKRQRFQDKRAPRRRERRRAMLALLREVELEDAAQFLREFFGELGMSEEDQDEVITEWRKYATDVANDVDQHRTTVEQDPEEAAEELPESERGIYRKYSVTRLRDRTGKHKNCWYFVLDPRHDPHARAALKAYAASCREEYGVLADELEEVASRDWTAFPQRIHAGEDENGFRDYLDGKPIRDGDQLHLWNDDAWVRVTYSVDPQSFEARLTDAGGTSVKLDRLMMGLRWPPPDLVEA